MAGEYIEIHRKTAYFSWGSCPVKLRGKSFKLKTGDGEELDIDAEGLCMSRTLLQQALTLEDGATIETSFKKASLVKVLEYLKYHQEQKPYEIRVPLESDNLVECGASKWDASFINLDKEIFFDVMAASITLDIPSLYFLCGAKATLLIKGKEPSKLVKDFKLSNDLPDDEEEQLAGLFAAQKEALYVNPDESSFGGMAVLMNAVYQAGERNGILAPSKTEEPCPSAIPLKSFRHASWRAMILSDWTQFKDAPEEVLADRDLFFACLPSSKGMVLEWAPGEFREDRKLILEAIKYRGENMAEADDSLKSDKDFLMEAIAIDGAALSGATDEIRGDQEFILGACQLGHGSCMKGALDHLKGDKAFMLQAACKCPEAFKYASDDLRYDDLFVMLAVGANGLILQHVPTKYTFDREVVKAAVNSDPRAAYYAHASARAELNLYVPHDGEPELLQLKKVQDKAGIGGKHTKTLFQWSRQPMNKEQAEEDGIIFKHVKAQKIVQFSALSTMTANMGQSNYVAANCYLDKMPFFERPETDAVTLMWGAVGNIGMRWKAFASQDMLNANPEALMHVSDAAKVLTMTATRMDPPEWYAGSFFDEWTRQSMLMPTAGVHSGEDYKAISLGANKVDSWLDAPKEAHKEERKLEESEMPLQATESGPLGGWPTLFEEPASLAAPALPEPELCEGLRVQLRGLQPAKNGLLGTLLKKCKEDKWKVRLDKGENALLKAEYLVAASAAAPPADGSAKETRESEERRARLKASIKASEQALAPSSGRSEDAETIRDVRSPGAAATRGQPPSHGLGRGCL
eukprot:CAMPEP_0171255810 /NCGR_PEP_ID=MMETSP0790-20130122/52966_1 /TAXON_ID=2925 /ORGANISM="Alexandrium catenella, Strain OF101" /LENGTH=803 /DNA_ID=CAMNT_0011723789 /DNA_START=65 /DNA_END=2477 /DNA_ORIENTATION=+